MTFSRYANETSKRFRNALTLTKAFRYSDLSQVPAIGFANTICIFSPVESVGAHAGKLW